MGWELHSETVRPEQVLADITWDSEGHDSIQRDMPEIYTHMLAINRDSTYKEFQDCLLSEVTPFFSNKSVLELGPGAANIFYKMVRGGSSKSWTAMDISPRVMNNIGRYQEQHPGYYTVQGTFRRLPFASESLDVVCGLCSLDSIIDVDTVGAEILRVLKPGGILLHVQDLPPSRATLSSLIAREQQGQEFVLHSLKDEDHGKGAPTVITTAVGELIDTHDYLHKALESVFINQGLRPIETAHRIMAWEMLDEYWMVRNILSPDKEEMNCSYSVLTMRKP